MTTLLTILYFLIGLVVGYLAYVDQYENGGWVMEEYKQKWGKIDGSLAFFFWPIWVLFGGPGVLFSYLYKRGKASRKGKCKKCTCGPTST